MWSSWLRILKIIEAEETIIVKTAVIRPEYFFPSTYYHGTECKSFP